MASYHRTQILLEPWQYGTLKALAEREGVSLSDMVRRILTQQLRPQSSRRRGLQAIAGIGRDRKAAGRYHDRWLYGPAPQA
jgi:hypothetical protein